MCLEVTNSWLHQSQQVVQVLKEQSSPRPSHYHHHVWLLVRCSFPEMLCYFYTRCNGTHTSQKFNFWFVSPQNIFPKVLVFINMFHLAKLRSAFMLFLVSGGFVTLPSSHFCLTSFWWLIVIVIVMWFTTQMVESWTLTLTEDREACRSFDIVVGSFVTSWMSRLCALGVIFVVRSVLGRFTMFSPFVDNGSHCGPLEPQSLRNGFVTFSRLIDVDYFVSRLFLNFIG